MSSIKPSIGRKVWFYSDTSHPGTGILDTDQPFDATVTYVYPDGRVNLSVHPHNDFSYMERQVELRDPQEGDRHGAGERFATWMPYQVGQAKAAEPLVLDTDKLEQAIQARASIGPRITPADVENEIASEFYFTALEGTLGARGAVTTHNGDPLRLLTFCVLVLRNGFTVTGTSASPENFDAEIGRQVARRDAERQVWPLLGFRLRDRLAKDPRRDDAPVSYGGTSEDVN